MGRLPRHPRHQHQDRVARKQTYSLEWGRFARRGLIPDQDRPGHPTPTGGPALNRVALRLLRAAGHARVGWLRDLTLDDPFLRGLSHRCREGRVRGLIANLDRRGDISSCRYVCFRVLWVERGT